MSSEIDLYHELSFYTLSHPDGELFLHQYAVDAFAAQHSRDNPKPITTAFALIGLYLFAVKGFTGRQVQRVHMQLGKPKRSWPIFDAPSKNAKMSVGDVLKVEPGDARDHAIKEWARSVWEVWQDRQPEIEALLQ